MHAEWWSYLIIYCNVYLYVKILYKKPVALVYCVHLVYIYILGFGSVLQDFDTVIWDLYRIYHRWATQMGGNLWFRWGPRRSTNGLCSLRMTGPSRRCFCAWVAWVASVAGVALRQGTAIPIESIRILTSWWIEIEILNGWGGMLLQFDVLISLWVEFLHAQEQRFLPQIWDAMIALNITGKALLESFGTAGHDWGKILGSSSWSLFCCPVAGDPTCAHGIALATRVSRRHVRGHWTVSMRAARWGNPKTKKGQKHLTGSQKPSRIEGFVMQLQGCPERAAGPVCSPRSQGQLDDLCETMWNWSSDNCMRHFQTALETAKHVTARDRQAFVSRWIDSTLQRLNRSTQGPLDATWVKTCEKY